MIESITIAPSAIFGPEPQELVGLSQFNFFFGANASGKTTLSRLIADENSFPSCNVTWKGRMKLEAMVYNRDFVDRHIHQPAELKGVFTLGEEQVDTLAKITKAKAELDTQTARIESLAAALEGTDGTGGKKGELAALESKLKVTCWEQKLKHDAKLQGAFEGFRNNAERFKAKVLQELDSHTATLLSLADLESRCSSVFGPTPSTEAPVPALVTTQLLVHETHPVLKKRVIGRDDVDIAAMIRKLGNSDWVREGRAFFEANDDICPFCQRRTPAGFAHSLNEYFDETFLVDTRAIDDLVARYGADAARVQQQLAAIISSPSRFLDIEALKAEKELLETKIRLNDERLADKKKEPSQVVELETLRLVLTAIQALLDSASAQVAAHNQMVANLASERKTLIREVWRFIVEELKDHLTEFKKQKGHLDKAIENITAQIETAKRDRAAKELEIRELERRTTSVQPTIDAINSLLSEFGFQGFKLARSASGTSYRLVRPDGRDAKSTLSEGEKTFVTFLYFYHLLKGSATSSGVTTDRIVVIDDPVSSLDSEVLFIVSTLIKELFGEMRDGTAHIKQVFVLTHNVYFHKEVTFSIKRQNRAMNEETFWVLRKSGLGSKIEKHQCNPVKTSYELLWAELRREDRSDLTIPNTLRRILETYFTILGGENPDTICAYFAGRDKLICKSLFSWVHAGSHSAFDDIDVAIDGRTVETYLNVFEQIFRRSHHSAHYEMMMRKEEEALPAATV